MTNLWQKNDDQAIVTADRNSGNDIPVTFDEAWNKSVASYDFFSASNFRLNARRAVVQDYLDSVHRRTGERPIDSAFVGGQNVWSDTTPEEMIETIRPHIEKLKQKYPDMPMLSAEELDTRATQKAVKARDDYAEMNNRYHAWGTWLGEFGGGLYAGAKDPLNIATIAVNPAKSYGVVQRALVGAGVFGGSQALNELMGAEGRDQIQPGYSSTREGYYNILESAGMGALLFGGPKMLGNAWARMRTGKWPGEVKDAGNVVMSEGQIEGNNIHPGPEGEILHRKNLGTATDQILKGEPVNVDVPPDVRRRSQFILDDLEKKSGMRLPVVDEGKLKLLAENEGLSHNWAELERYRDTLDEPDHARAEKAARLEQVEKRLDEISFEKARPEVFREATAERAQLEARQAELLKGETRQGLDDAARTVAEHRRVDALQGNLERRAQEIKDEVRSALPHTVSFDQTLREAEKNFGDRMVVPRRGAPRDHWMTAAMSGDKRQAITHSMHPQELEATAKSPQAQRAELHDIKMKVHGPELPKPGDKFKDDKGEYTIDQINHTTTEINGRRVATVNWTGERPDGTIVHGTGHPHEQVTLNGKPIAEVKPMREQTIEVGRNDDGKKMTAEQAYKEVEDLQKAADELESCLNPVAAAEAAGGAT